MRLGRALLLSGSISMVSVPLACSSSSEQQRPGDAGGAGGVSSGGGGGAGTGGDAQSGGGGGAGGGNAGGAGAGGVNAGGAGGALIGGGGGVGGGYGGFAGVDGGLAGTGDGGGLIGAAPDGTEGPPSGTGAFALTDPADGAMVTTTRTPTLTWSAVAGATKYEVWINVTRTDYDWTDSRPLIDRFTKVADVTAATYTTLSLPDRWTYKWFIKAVTGGTTTVSAVRRFSIYMPTVEQVDDGVSIVNGCRDLNKNGTIEPFEDWHNTPDKRADDLMGRLTKEEKALQLFYNGKAKPEAGWQMGPLGGNDPNTYQTASAKTKWGIPLVTAGDTMHGYGNVYPTEIGLAATRNLDIVFKVTDMQRKEQVTKGERGLLGPLAEVATKPTYPRIQEGGGEDADLVAAIVRAMVAGLQGGPELNPASAMAMEKHWPGEGAGGEGIIVYDDTTIGYHMRPWRAAIDTDVGSIMPGYAGSRYLSPEGGGGGDAPKILAYLRTLGYKGVVTTDWLGSGSWVKTINAGSDVNGGADATDAQGPAAVVAGCSDARVDEAARRVLLLKFKLGIFENPYGDPNGYETLAKAPASKALTKQAAAEGLTLLKNDGTLPLKAGKTVLIAGPRAKDGPSCCIWTSYFHAGSSQTIFQALQAKAAAVGATLVDGTAGTVSTKPDVVVAAIGEPSYTHRWAWMLHTADDAKLPGGDCAPISLPSDQISLLKSYADQGIPIVSVIVLPRPMVLDDVVGMSNSLLVAYRSGEGAGPAIADLLFGEFTPKGRLPFQLPKTPQQISKTVYENVKGERFGTGVTFRYVVLDAEKDAAEAWDLPYDLGATDAERTEIKALIAAGKPVEPKYGQPLFQYGAGMQGWQ
jgi:beta-glucosidase